MDPKTFIAAIAPAAKQLMHTAGIPASVTLAQAALESGWGKSELATDAGNLFGVKADSSWHGDTININTKEYLAGKWCLVPAKWRKYPDWAACIADREQFFHKNPRYANALACKDCESFAAAIQKAGYATDPKYAALLIDLIKQHNLSQFDTEAS